MKKYSKLLLMLAAITTLFTSTLFAQTANGEANATKQANLSRQAIPTMISHPEYPEHLRQAGIGGTVKVTIAVDNTGAVTNVIQDENQLTANASVDPRLVTATIEAAKGYAYKPALDENGTAIESSVPFSITFGPSKAQPSRIAIIRGGSVLNDQAITLPKPIFSAEANAAGLNGQGIVRVTVGSDGTVTNAAVESSVSPLLNKAYIDAAVQATFKPGEARTGVIVYNSQKQ